LFGPTADDSGPVLATSITWDEREPFAVVGVTREPGVEVSVLVQHVGEGSDWIGVGRVTSDEDGFWELEISHDNLPARWNEEVFQPMESGFFLVLGVFAASGSVPSPEGDHLMVVSAS
jgi:hypothetical protein